MWSGEQIVDHRSKKGYRPGRSYPRSDSARVWIILAGSGETPQNTQARIAKYLRFYDSDDCYSLYVAVGAAGEIVGYGVANRLYRLSDRAGFVYLLGQGGSAPTEEAECSAVSSWT
jgi:hypothetical protein